MKVGYARVSTKDQKLNLQLDALRRDGCDKIFKEKISGTKADRPAISKALSTLNQGDEFVVWKLDRLGRSVKHLSTILDDFVSRGIILNALTDGIKTDTPTGELIYHIACAVAQYERRLVSERTKAGLMAARLRGSRLGRPRTLSKRQIKSARQMRQEEMSYSEIAEKLNVARTTLWRSISQYENDDN